MCDRTVKLLMETDPELLRRAEKNEARYILSLSDDYSFLTYDDNLTDEEIITLYRILDENNICLDEALSTMLKSFIKEAAEGKLTAESILAYSRENRADIYF